VKAILSLLAGLFIVAASANSQEFDWPKELTGESGGVVLIYQPQVEEFSGNRVEARAAVSVKSAATDNKPIFGAVWIKARLDTNRDTRTAVLSDVEISDVRLAEASDEQREALATYIEDSIENTVFEISVDQFLSGVDNTTVAVTEAELKHDAPDIILSREPAMLIPIDGEPVLQEIEGSQYERIVNSPFLIVKDGRAHYLYIGSDTWYLGRDIMQSWTKATSVPGDIQNLVEPAEDDAEDPGPLNIIVVTAPSELLISDGEPSWSPVEDMNLLYMDNTDSNVFLELSTQRYYVLLSGRWYRGEAMADGIDWVHVPNDQLPGPFSDIEEGSVNAAVLSQVAGTQQARDAVLDNTIPQTAAIDREDASFTVQYNGEPDFAPIEEIEVQYAQNTSAAVFRYGNLYYACDEGVWYVSNLATGPWTVATDIPEAIYKIPASNPHHNVTYVKVYDVTPEVVYVGYTPGYYGSYYYHGAVIYGTGWYYNPWYGPWYYPRYPTWGFHVSYNPWSGWGFGMSWTNGPFRFTFSRHGGWWGVGGFRPYPRPHVHAGYRKTNININNNINVGGNRPETRPNLYDRPQNRDRQADRGTTASTRQARPANNVQNNVLTDQAGSVYRRDTDGNWNRRENGEWTRANNLDRPNSGISQGNQPSQMPADRNRSSANYGSSRPSTQPSYSSGRSSYQQSATRPQLERDYGSRQQGANRASSYQRQRSATPRRR
jgi:hypothetical protein